MSQLSHSPESAPNPDRGLIRDATPEDVTAICQIYNHYVAKTIITFEETPISEAEMIGRMDMQRDGNTLNVIAFWREAGVRMGAARLNALQSELQRAARFGRCDDVVYNRDWLREQSPNMN